MRTSLSSSHRKPRGRRKGSILVLVAMSLVVLLIGVAFAVDLAFVQCARTEVKAACDLSALAAVEAMTREQSHSDGEKAAKDLAKTHLVAGSQFKLKSSDIQFGRHSLAGDGSMQFNPGVQPFTAVEVTGSLADGEANSPLPSMFARVFGVNTFAINRTSIGVQMDRDIVLVLDISTSMKGDDRFAGMITAANAFVDEIIDTHETERVMIVSYNHSAYLNQALTENTATMRNAINSLAIDESGTAIGEGLLSATNALQADPGRRALAQSVIILMTDGQHNTGVNPSSVVGTAAARHHRVNTITFSDSANQSDMIAVANAGKGIHMHASDNAALVDAFEFMAQSVDAQLMD